MVEFGLPLASKKLQDQLRRASGQTLVGADRDHRNGGAMDWSEELILPGYVAGHRVLGERDVVAGDAPLFDVIGESDSPLALLQTGTCRRSRFRRSSHRAPSAAR